MKRILGWLCIIFILVMSMTAGTIVSFAATTSTATVTDVYASGNWTVGQQVTAHYTAQDSNATVQWYRTGNLKDNTLITGATSSTYTLQADDCANNFNSVYFTITDSNGKVFYSPVYIVKAATTTKSEVSRAHLILKGGATSYVPGAVVGMDHDTAFVNTTEGTHTYVWKVKDTRGGTATTIVGSDATYTIKDSDYGKYLEGSITVKDAAGTTIGTKSATAYVGSKLDFDATIIAVSNFYTSTNTKEHLANRLWYQAEDNFYGKKNTAVSVTIDANKTVKFDGFNLTVTNVASNLKISYSNDNSTWYDLPLTGTTTGTVKTGFSFGQVYKARYFKVSYTASNAYPVFYEAYPYLSATNRSADYVDIKSVGYGAVADNDALSISNIAYGMPANELASSVVAMKDDAVITLTDASGVEVADASSVKLTPANVANYRIKVVHGNASQTYTLAAGALKTIDFSSLPEGTKYTTDKIDNVSTGFTRNVPGSKATYWYSDATTAEDYPYAMRETMEDGTYALKVDANGNPRSSDGGVVNLWYGIEDIDAEGCYSFKFKVKPDEDSHVQLGGRPNINVTGGNFDGGFVQLNTTGLFVHNGTELVRKADFAEDKWYNVEVVVDYKNNKKSVWVDGVNYVDGADFTISNTTYNKSGLMMNITILAQQGGENDINYIKDLEFNKVWDVHTKLSADGEGLGMKLYNGEAVVDTLTAGTYSAKGNGNVFSDEYYVAVYKVTYSDSTKLTEIDRDLIKAYHANGSADAQITDIEVPASAYSDTSKAVVKIFCFNNELKPARDFVLID